jgi:5-formyltetrahydrofolate cyclo-ligase
MIFDSLGLGELGVVALLGIFLLDPKKLGSMLRQFAQFRRKLNQMQNQVRTQLNTLVLEDELRENTPSPHEQRKTLRKWSRDQVAALTAHERREKSDTITEAIKAWPSFQAAESICAFVGRYDEVDTEAILQTALDAGKTLYLPYVHGEVLGFSAVRDLKRDLVEGALGILEPMATLRNTEDESMTLAARQATITLVPGVTFDAFGGRLGHGKGYYDRHLAQAKTFAVGIAFEAQVHAKKLPLAAHDQTLQALVTESRFLLFADPNQATKGQ